MRSAEEVLQSHLALRQRKALEEDIELNYAPHVVLLTHEGVLHGHEGVRESGHLLHRQLPDGEYEYHNLLINGDVGFLEWTGRGRGSDVCDGADSYEVRDGKIVAQTIHYVVHHGPRQSAREIRAGTVPAGHSDGPHQATAIESPDPLLQPEVYARQHRVLYPRTFHGRAAGTAGGQMVIGPQHWGEALATFLNENRGRKISLAVRDGEHSYHPVTGGVNLLNLEYDQEQAGGSVQVSTSVDGTLTRHAVHALREMRLLVAADGTPGGLELTGEKSSALLRLIPY